MILPANMKILVVDDNEFARATAVAILMRVGAADIVDVTSGAEAIARMLVDRFDVLLTDWYMPETSGAGLIKIVRSRGFGLNRDIPIIVMTAYATRENLGMAKALGLTEILVKPLEQSVLTGALARAANSATMKDWRGETASASR